METSKLALACPVCGSAQVYYTCTPNCCFNHVCNECGSTFEPVTTATGKTLGGVVPPVSPPDAADPTVACAKCDATAVYSTADGRLVCVKCGSVLVLEFTEIAPG